MSTCEMDERKRKRMMSNRESAKRSRMKKQQHLDGLVKELARFNEENAQIMKQVNITAVKHSNLDAENTVMRAQVMALTERLKLLNSILKKVEAESGMAIDIPEIPDTYLRPWPLPCSVQPIMLSPYMFQC